MAHPARVRRSTLPAGRDGEHGQIAGREYLVGNSLTGADVQLSFVAQVGIAFNGKEAFPNLTKFVDRIEARPAYQRAMAKGGP